MECSWVPLPELSVTDLPTSLCNFARTEDGYVIRLTDLQSIWAESLDRQKIIDKALELDCGLEIADDAGQMDIFLQKLEGALHASHGSTLRLRSAGKDEIIRIYATIPLPVPLDPLKWTFTLERCPSSHFSKFVTIPLLANNYFQKLQLANLMNSIKEKDSAISKIIDKVDAAGIDLATIFPTLAHHGRGLHADKKTQLYRHVKGLGPFDKSAWMSEISKNEPSDLVKMEVLRGAFHPDENAVLSAIGRALRDTEHNSPRAAKVTVDALPAAHTLTDVRPQQSPTPRHAKGSRLGDDDDGEETTDEEGPQSSISEAMGKEVADMNLRQLPELDKSALPSSETPAPRGVRESSALPLSMKRESPDSEADSANAKHPTHNLISSSESREQGTEALKRREYSKPVKLGVIGGQRKQRENPIPGGHTTSEEVAGTGAATHEPTSISEEPTSRSPKHEGRKKHRSDNSIMRSADGKSSPISSETSQERAQRKREELKRELDTQTKLQSKKKRKF